MKLAWATDIHLDHLESDSGSLYSEPRFQRFLNSVKEASPNAIVITGDISIFPLLKSHLETLEKTLKIPILYVLGNHDFYGGTIQKTREIAQFLNQTTPNIRWLGGIEHARLTKNVAIVGHDCWYDALNGDWKTSQIFMSDWITIEDFSLLQKNVDLIVKKARQLSQQSSDYLKNCLESVSKNYSHVIIATHVPPFLEACLQEGKCIVNDAVPWYTSKLAGQTIFEIAKKYPGVKFTVLSGHTHGRGKIELLPNLEAIVGRSQYGRPYCQGFISLS